MNMHKYSMLALALTLPGACNDSVGEDTPEGFDSDFPALAVHHSDYSTSTVALLDQDGNVLDSAYIGGATQVIVMSQKTDINGHQLEW